jgi:hypothetical protein
MGNKIDVKALVEILHSNNSDVTEKFSSSYPNEILKFCEHIDKCNKIFNKYNSASNPSERLCNVGAFVFLGVDNLFTSMHLLMQGYLIPSGNMLRQSLEAVAMAVLLSEVNELEVIVKKGWSTRNFYKDFLNNMKHTQSHHSLRWMEKNSMRLKLSNSGLEILRKSKNFYNNYSHPNLFSLSSRMVMGNSAGFITGGIYDEDKEIFYVKEVRGRESYGSHLPEAIACIFERADAAM